jgi:hypothetical protein
LIGSRVFNVKSYGEGARLLRILLDIPGPLQHLNVVGDGGGGLQTYVITDLADGRRKVALSLAGDDEFEDLATHGCEYFGHGLPFMYEQLFVGYSSDAWISNTCS